MRLVGFRIINFKSIKDSQFRNVSPDNITGLIGQNESGKTSILEALEAFSSKKMSKSQFRVNSDEATIYCKFKFNDKDIFSSLVNKNYYLPMALESDLQSGTFNEITLKIKFRNQKDENVSSYEIYEDDPINNYFENMVTESLLELVGKFIETTKKDDISKEEQDRFVRDVDMLLPYIVQKLPVIKFLNNNTILPTSIAIREIPQNNSESMIVRDFLNIINIPLNSLHHYQNNFMEMKNKKDKELKVFWKDLKTIWKMYLGEEKNIPKVYFDIESFSSANASLKQTGQKVGEPYLVFSIQDKNGYFDISQRSLGFKLYLSIFIALKSAQLENKDMILLLDEPGVNLHANGQRSLLKLFEELKKDIDIIYTTHSSHLIDIDHIYRILTVENVENDDDELETKIERYNTLGNTTYDTLLPLYTSIGMNISNQEVIKKNRNLLIEEISSFYYIKVFWDILGYEKEINILPLSGASKAIDMSLLLMGWGIDHSVLVDNDSEGKRVIKKFKEKKIYPDERLLTISEDGVEELFSKIDFEKYIILDSLSDDISITDFMKKNKNKYSKAVIARDFYVRYINNEFELNSLSEETIKNFQNICKNIDESFETKFILN